MGKSGKVLSMEKYGKVWEHMPHENVRKHMETEGNAGKHGKVWKSIGSARSPHWGYSAAGDLVVVVAVKKGHI